MEFPFSDVTREQIARQCAAFERRSARMKSGLKRAGVAIALVEADPPRAATAFLLTLRMSHMRAHAGQWALPGGRCDAGETVIDAALRELHEELGLRIEPEHVLGLLDEYPTRSGYLITPVVVWAGAGVRIGKNASEVDSVFRIPLTDIVPDHVVSFVSIPESDRQVVRIHINDDHVNAPTGAILYQFRELLLGRTTRVADYEQPVFAWR